MEFSVEERVEYYTSNLNEQITLCFDTNKQLTYWCIGNSRFTYEEKGRCFHKKWVVDKYFDETNFRDNSQDNPIIDYDINAYITPIIKLFNSDKYFENKKFLLRAGDVFFSIPVPVITKTRPTKNLKGISVVIPHVVNENNKAIDEYATKNVLINLDIQRHWINPIENVIKHDIPFKSKNNKIIWRGGFTGFGWDQKHETSRPSRKVLCEKYNDHCNDSIDIGPTGSNPYEGIFTYNGKIKDHINISQQLKSKFIISVEGGDIATNLKWILYSNSVSLMAKPTICSWLMEDKLEPWVHYVPLDDQFDDLEEKYTWCLTNLDKCEEIANNGKKYIEQFLDQEREAKITNLVLRKYVDNVKLFYK